jgi:hypothetical protein
MFNDLFCRGLKSWAVSLNRYQAEVFVRIMPLRSLLAGSKSKYIESCTLLLHAGARGSKNLLKSAQYLATRRVNNADNNGN